MKICSNCRSNVPREAAFCQKCGAMFAQAKETSDRSSSAEFPIQANGKGRKPILIAVIVLILIFLTTVGSTYYMVNPKRIDYSSIIPNIEVKQTTEFNFKNSYMKDVVVTGSAKDKVPAHEKNYVGIMSFNLKKMTWEVVYEERMSADGHPKVTIARLLPENVDQAIISSRAGSGGFLSYTLIGWVDNQAKLLLKKSGIFQGSIVIEGNQLIEKSGHQGTAYQWNGKSFVPILMPAENQAPLSVGDIQIEFSIDADKNVRVSNMDVTLQKGKKLFLRRTNTGISERVLSSGGGVLEYNDGAYVGIGAGNTKITIIPGGYEWSQAKEIKVTVIE